MKTFSMAGAIAVVALALGVSGVSAQGGGQGGNGSGNQAGPGMGTEERNMVGNQGETTQVRTMERNMVQDGSGAGQGQGPMDGTGSQGRMGNAIQTMLRIAERNQGEAGQTGNQIQAHIETHRELQENALRLEERNRFTRFLIGPDQDAIRKSEALLEQNRLRIQEMDQVRDRLQDEADRGQFQEQLRILEEEQTRLEERIRSASEGFSLFGWLFR